jgi:CheY-like chemotaxis protein
LASRRFDVLVSDIGMPEQDGYAFIRSVRAHASSQVSRIPAAALTAYARSEDGARAVAAGYQLHLAKPVDPQHLTDVVSSLSRMGQQLEA